MIPSLLAISRERFPECKFARCVCALICDPQDSRKLLLLPSSHSLQKAKAFLIAEEGQISRKEREMKSPLERPTRGRTNTLFWLRQMIKKPHGAALSLSTDTLDAARLSLEQREYM